MHIISTVRFTTCRLSHPKRMRFLLFFLIWFSILGLSYYYVGRRLVKPSRLQRAGRTFVWVAIAVWFLVPIVPFVFFLNGAQSGLLDIFSWTGYWALGLFSLVFVMLLLRDSIMLIHRMIVKIKARLRKNNPSATNFERRRFLIHSSNIGIMGGATVLSGYGLFESHKRAEIERIDIPLPNLPASFDGFRIAQFTDLHIGPTIKRRFVERVTEQVNELKADCIVFTGDLVDGSVWWLRDDVAPLKELNAPFGKFFITGNHEYYSGAIPWINEAGKLGFDVLMNEHRIIQRNEGRIVMAGVTDYSAGDFHSSQKSDPMKALANASADLVRVLLAHQPRSIFEAVHAGIDVQLSGHTHGGQFFPWNHLATLNQPYIKGLHKHQHAWVYVSRGTGYWGPPLRLGIPPEITLISLVRA